MMSEVKFTPGPYTLNGDHENGIEIIGPRAKCNLNGKPGWKLAVVDNGCFPEHEDEDWATAHLFKAAPDLYAELRNNIETLIDFRDNHLAHAAAFVRAIVQRRIEAGQAAIAKATAIELANR